MEGISFDPFLKTGIIFAILSLSGWVPVIKLMLAIQQSGVASSWHMCWRIIEGILAGPVDFLGLILKMIVDISSTFMGSKLLKERGFEGGRNFGNSHLLHMVFVQVFCLQQRSIGHKKCQLSF